MGKEIIVQSPRPKFESPNLGKKLGMVTCIYDPNAVSREGR